MPLATFLNGTIPAQLRGLAWLALSDTGSVLTRTIVDDTGGGGTATYAAGTAIPCRVDPLTGSSRITGGAVDERSTHLITVPNGTTIAASARFAVTNRGTFEVTAVRTRTAEQTTTFEVLAIS